MLGQQNQTHSIATAIVDITDTTRKLSENYESLTKITWDLKGEMDKFKFYLQASHKLVVTCREADLLVDSLIDDAETMNEIRKKARQNLPSESLFPLKQILEKTRILEKERKNAFPLFREEHEIEHIYAMSISATTIDKNIIHSVISIPLVSFNQRFEFIEPTLKDDEIDIIENLSKVARKPIDYILCANAHQIKVLSSAKLLRCIKTHNSKIFFCNERSIINFKHKSTRCSNLPSSIVIELTSHKLLIKTNLKTMDIICNKVHKTVPISRNYSIIDLNPNCRIRSEDFMIEEIKNNEAMTFHAEPFKVTNYRVGNPSFHELEDMKIKHLEITKMSKDLQESQKRLDKDIKKITDADSVNQRRVVGIVKGVETNNTFTYTFGSLTILSILGVISFIIVLCRMSKKSRNTGLNVSIKQVKTKGGPETDAEDNVE